MRAVLVGCLWGWVTLAYGQGQVSGKIVDQQTRQPVPYASVAVLGQPQGTTSNAEGEFVLALPALPGRLVVSQLSYQRDTVRVAAAGVLPLIQLVPAPVTLPTVEMGSYSAELLKNAYHELQRSNQHKYYGQAFYRQITQLDREPTEVQEVMWHAKASSAGLEGTVLAQARYTEKKNELLKMNNLSRFTKIFGLYSPTADTTQVGGILSPDPAAHYALRLLGITQNGSQNLAEIEFVGKPAFNPAHVQGTVTIDAATYQVLRFRVGTDVNTKSNNPTFKFKNTRLAYDVVYKSLPTGAVPDHMTTTYTATIGRMVRADIQQKALGSTYFYDWQPTPTGLAYAAPGKESDQAVIKQAIYDPAFWRDNPVVKRTPLEEEVIKSFEQQKSFGTLLNK
ncbi:MAG: carboxypeptidase-like regulatory domain-containing protein [Cytophagaceae bacterium]|nr:MAG: carboxypeptidase-like regulatory domain-containing protein [Cytophagaceae bacterium]